MGKFLGIDAFLISTAVGTMSNGVFVGEVNGVIALTSGEWVMMKGTPVGYPSADGSGITRGSSVQMTQSEKPKNLNKEVRFSEFKTDMTDNWTGKM